MKDRNGKEIKTGDTVEITGAYFKNDNGRFKVVHSAGDPDWLGKEHSLRKLNKNGTESQAKYRIAFWPLTVCVSSYELRCKAKKHNTENAQIEVIQEAGA